MRALRHGPAARPPERARSCSTSTARCATTPTSPRRRAAAARRSGCSTRSSAHAPRGRLLEVGCGHGLLLDEARKRGWAVEGLELADASREHARSLGLDVRDQTLEEAEGTYGAVVLADVLEHLDDPVGALRRSRGLLAPGGVALIVTPDPASRTARLAGSRWWGYLPSHTYLIPHATLRGLLRDAGLETVEERHFWRTFSFGYWIAGLGERSRPLAGRAGGGGAARRSRKRPLTMSLGDERVVIARR